MIFKSADGNIFAITSLSLTLPGQMLGRRSFAGGTAEIEIVATLCDGSKFPVATFQDTEEGKTDALAYLDALWEKMRAQAVCAYRQDENGTISQIS